ncbi:MAG: biopolymer transporter ExbD [Flavobacteriales bacterium]|nr:MAG: biopolymer transporter ExbD [Flavobacteriales bacterium]
MARVKPKRHGVVTDMTAMCDVAFLLLTFFILTTQFKKPDVEAIKPPSSISETILPDGSIMTVNITKDGRFYFAPVDNGTEKVELLEKMGKKYGVSFTDAEKISFAKAHAFGVPMKQMKSFLKLDGEKQKEVKGTTIPQDSVNSELIDWIRFSKEINPKYQLAVKGDATTAYPKVKQLFEGLRKENILKFQLITTQEGGGRSQK